MKKFLVKSLLMALPVVAVIVLYMHFVEPHRSGDIGNIGFLPFDDRYDSVMMKMAPDSNYVIEIEDIAQIQNNASILTIGDSFSQRKRRGYQNYLAMLFPNYQVYNLQPKGIEDQYQYAVDLLRNSDSLPQIIIVESVERALLPRLAYLNFLTENNVSQSVLPISDEEENSADDEVKRWNRAAVDFVEKNRKPILSTQEFIKKRCQIENSIKHLKLSRKLFTCNKLENDLFFYDEDLLEPKTEEITTGVENLKKLIALAESRGVKFVFLAAADKYDMYRDYVIDDPWKKMTCQLSYLSDFQDIHFVNGKKLLAPRIANGESDVYLCNDTHWSTKSARYVAEELKRRIDAQSR